MVTDNPKTNDQLLPLSKQYFAVTLSAVEMKRNQRSGRPLVEIAPENSGRT